MWIVKKRQLSYCVALGRKVGVVNSSIAKGWILKFSCRYKTSSADGSSKTIQVMLLNFTVFMNSLRITNFYECTKNLFVISYLFVLRRHLNYTLFPFLT